MIRLSEELRYPNEAFEEHINMCLIAGLYRQFLQFDLKEDLSDIKLARLAQRSNRLRENVQKFG
jgi:hypothetical protein